MPIFPKYKKRHGGGQLKNQPYAQIGKPAWWRHIKKPAICPNSKTGMVEDSQKVPNIPTLGICIAKSQQIIIKNK
jgi:hypothetical protein